jgi:biotin transporter BioY
MKDLEKRIARIEQRNKQVEQNKAWETSWTRRISIALLTYVVVWMYLQFVVHVDPWINAIIPTAGFLMSTLTLTFIKSVWIDKLRHEK